MASLERTRRRVPTLVDGMIIVLCAGDIDMMLSRSGVAVLTDASASPMYQTLSWAID